MSKLLHIDKLSAYFHQNSTTIKAVENASLQVKAGEITALIGESGSGKSVTALSVMKLIPPTKISYPQGKIFFNGQDISSYSQQQMQKIRGSDIGMIFQEPLTSLNPLHTVGKQITEAIKLHNPEISGDQAQKKLVNVLKEVGLGKLTTRLDSYPHQLSGGQRQRVVIAMAVANEPKLLIADEPTTALDVSTQKQVLKMFTKLAREKNIGILLITHNMSVVRQVSDVTYVMKSGTIVEYDKTNKILSSPKQEYTKRLLSSIPKGTAEEIAQDAIKILEVSDLKVEFATERNFFGRTTKTFSAIENISLSLKKSETLGIVGESGSGKSTLALAITKMVKSKGEIIFAGDKISDFNSKKMRHLRKDIQLIFQDPFASLNPRMTVEKIICESLDAHSICSNTAQKTAIVEHILEEVGLDKTAKNLYPHSFSGGQRQRICIARSLVLKPKVIIFDEPTSALDLCVQAQVISLLRELQKKYTLSYIFISHDLQLIYSISNNIAVMKNSKILEYGTAEDIFKHPKHQYTMELIDAAK